MKIIIIKKNLLNVSTTHNLIPETNPGVYVRSNTSGRKVVFRQEEKSTHNSITNTFLASHGIKRRQKKIEIILRLLRLKYFKTYVRLKCKCTI